jgi:CheY-like chemotaxis protein
MMPRCDGASFRAEQRADARLAHIPVVLLTADVRLEEKRRALDAVDLLPKPVQLEELLEVVRRHC